MQGYAVSLQLGVDVAAVDCPAEAEFERWVAAARAGHVQQSGAVGDDQRAVQGIVTVRVVSAVESAALNERYRAKHGPTNVLAFTASPPLVPDLDLAETELGDLAICLSVAQQEAEAQHKALGQHLAHLTVHGTLHLLGYDHIDAEDAAVMEHLEQTVMQSLGLPDPYMNT